MITLRPLAINVQFYKNNRIVFQGTTFATHVGFITGMAHSWSISLNYRTESANYYDELVRNATAILNGLSGIPTHALLLRRMLQENPPAEIALNTIRNTPITTNCYFVMSVVDKNGGMGGVVITRDVKKSINIETAKKNEFLVQTNHDRWLTEDQLKKTKSILSLKYSYKAMKQLEIFLTQMNGAEDQIAIGKIFHYVTTNPNIHGKHTAYTTIMHPKSGYYFSKRNLMYYNVPEAHLIVMKEKNKYYNANIKIPPFVDVNQDDNQEIPDWMVDE